MNEPLVLFLAQYREPATTAELWAEIALVKGWSEAADLPHTHAELDAELRKLLIAGRLACEGGLWRVVPVRVEPKQKQASLFG